jgi:hypothetical protein
VVARVTWGYISATDDFITDDSVHSSLQDRLNNLFTYTNDLCLSKRMNPDKSRNEYGSKLLKLCKSTGLRILNGRQNRQRDKLFLL